MTGVGLWRALKQKIGLGLPAVLITGMRDEASRLYGEQIGAAVLFKPIEEKALFEAIDRALGFSAPF
jgi:FixJ family two-component response regulator